MKLTIALIMLAINLAAAATTFAQQQQTRIIQTNSRADVIHVIDPATQSIVGMIEGIPVNHGAAAAPDGSRLYFTSEAKEALVVVDGKTLGIVKEIPLSARPHNISISKDGRHIYIGIMAGQGGIDIVDTQALEKVRHIDTRSRVHNTYVTPDGRYVVAGTFGGDKNMLVIDAATDEIVWSLFDKRNESALEGVRPIAFEKNPDGSTKRLFVQISEFNGFVVVDFAKRAEERRIALPEVPREEQGEPPFNGAPAHGIGVAPNGETLWVASRINGYVYAYSLPDLEFLAGVRVGSHPDWLTFTPDSRYVYVANGHSDDVSIIDIAERREIKRLKVGSAPKRNISTVLP